MNEKREREREKESGGVPLKMTWEGQKMKIGKELTKKI